MLHDGDGHVLHKDQFIKRQARTRLLVRDSIDADPMATFCFDGNSGVENYPRLLFDITFVFEAVNEAHIIDDQGFCRVHLAICLLNRMLLSKSVMTDSVVPLDDRVSQPDLIARLGPIGFEGQRLRGFCEDVLLCRIDEGDHSTADIEP